MITNEYDNLNVTRFPGLGHNNEITFAAATTCYQSAEHTKLSAAQFVEMFRKSNHRTPLEFSWYVLKISSGIHQIRFLWDLLVNITPYIQISLDYTENSAIVSGNGRAFYDLYEYAAKYDLCDNQISTLYSTLFNTLHELNPVLFSEHFDTAAPEWDVVPIPEATLEHADKHKWAAFHIQNISIGCSRELNRHRTFSINERSTRYTGAGRGDQIAVIYPNDVTWNTYVKPSLATLYRNFLLMKSANYKNDITRQLLPLATVTEEIVAGRISDWKHFLELRDASEAHWEIRRVAERIKLLIG